MGKFTFRTHGFGLKGLSLAVLGVDLDKSDRTARSNWEAQPLSNTQVCTHCYLTLELTRLSEMDLTIGLLIFGAYMFVIIRDGIHYVLVVLKIP